MKKIATALCTMTLLMSFSACGVEKPDLGSVTEKVKSSEGSSAREKETEKKTLSRKDSHLKGDFAKRFHVDADIEGEKANLPTYYLSKINLSEDQLAEKLMSSPEYNRSESEKGIVFFSNEKETLAIDMNGLYSNPVAPSPSLTYALDKGKEYEEVIKGNAPYESLDSEASKKAVAQVTEILDKLPIQYHEHFDVEKVNYDFLNEMYSFHVDPANQPEIPDEVIEQLDLPEDGSTIISNGILKLAEGKDAKLDKDFKFSKDDSCFVVAGNMKVNDMQISGAGFNPYSITAAVSSRGVEYLYIEDLYIPDNGSSDSSTVTAEQAAEAVYKDWDSVPEKENYEVYINKMSLKYTKEIPSSDKEKADTSKAKLRPVWDCELHINSIDHGYATVSNCEVYADTGEMTSPFFEEFISYESPLPSES